MAMTFIDEHDSSTNHRPRGVVERIESALVTVLIGNEQEEWTFPAGTVPAGVEVGDVLILSPTEHGWRIEGIDPEPAAIVWHDDIDAKLDKVRHERPSLFSRPPAATPPAPRPTRPSALRRQNLRGLGAAR